MSPPSSERRPPPLWRIIVAATGVELTGVAGLATALGLLGGRWGRLDALNNLAPIWCVLALAGLLLVGVGLDRRPARAVLSAVAVGSILVGGAPILWDLRGGLDRAPAVAGRPPLKVVTFNASAESYDGDIAAAVVMKADPDLVAMQEPYIVLRAAQGLAARYPHAVTCPKDRGCPLVIWSKRPILRSGYVVKRAGQAGWSDVDLLWAETTAPDGGRVILATTHLLWPVPASPQEVQRALLARQLRRLPPGDLVFAGDLNSAPWTFALRGLDAQLAPLTRRTRALMTWPAFVPRIFTRVAAPFLAIDHVYAGPSWTTLQVRRLGEAASDHYPVEVTLARTGSPK